MVIDKKLTNIIHNNSFLKKLQIKLSFIQLFAKNQQIPAFAVYCPIVFKLTAISAYPAHSDFCQEDLPPTGV